MKFYPPLMVLFGLIVQSLVALLVPLGHHFPPIAAGFGAVLVLVGVWPALSINRAFKQAKTSILPDAIPEAFVETGLFRYSRNPIYVGMSLVLAGGALISGLVVNLCAVPLFMIAVTRLWIVKEEQNLLTKFGAQYADYQKRVRRWI